MKHNHFITLTLAMVMLFMSMQVFADWSVYGQLEGDTDWTDHVMTENGSSCSLTVSLAAGREYYFKVKHSEGGNETWFSYGTAITRTTAKDVDFSSDNANSALATTVQGNYIFTLNTDRMSLSVTYPDALAPEAIYSTSVPSENGDVMIQAYYWAHEENTSTPWTPYGGVQWTDLDAQAAELGQYFDLVWLAPSAETADYTGFLPVNYSNQNNIWGSESELRSLIQHLHGAGAKVVADIVINHSNASEGFCTWNDFNFGDYGTFQPVKSWIANDDEIFISENDDRYKRYDIPGHPEGVNAGMKEEAGECGNDPGPYSDENDFTYGETDNQQLWSYAEYNCVYSRDWSHKSKDVREMSRAYLTWMNEYIGYDGWRYDFAKGIHGSHINDYNKASNAAFSVAEIFDGDINKEIGVLRDANFNTYVFDFPAKYQVMNEGIRVGNYYKLLGNATSTMLYNYKKYTVTFVDNHDTFREDYNICGTPNDIADSAKVIMANAYILAMPGVPCVFYPYWYKYKAQLKPMIEVRKMMGVHSESVVSDDAGEGYYKATITGKYGNIRLLLGPNSGWNECPEGYILAYKGATDNICVGIYYKKDEFYLKHNWNGGEWSWSGVLRNNGDGTFSLRAQYGGSGCNWNRAQADAGAQYVEFPDVEAGLAVGQWATFTLDTLAGTIHIAAARPVYFANTSNWENVFAYAWREDGNKNSEWPGEQMTLEGTFNGSRVYSYIMRDIFYDNVIFNNGSAQTQDLSNHESECYVPDNELSDNGWKSLSQLTTPLTVSSCTWATTYLPFAVTLPDGLYGYYASAQADNTITLSLLADNAVPAQTGVLLTGAAGEYSLTATSEPIASVVSLLGGTKVETLSSTIGTNLYVLSKSQTEASQAAGVYTPVFGPYTGETLAAGKAYLLLDGSSQATQIRFVIENTDNATDIDALAADGKTTKCVSNGRLIIIRDGIMYDALGQRIR